jgi:3-methyladenine DNA glycosylase AlkC
MARGVTPSGYSLKDQLFNLDKVRYLADQFSPAYAKFDRARFERAVMSKLLKLELKQRVNWIAQCLQAELPPSLPEASPILLAALPEPLDPSLSDNDFGDFIIAPFGEVVLALGLDDNPQLVLDLLGEITKRFSMEFALRAVLNRWGDLTLVRLQEWAGHENYHIRRLVSEGTRPKLPWGQGIDIAPEQMMPLLDELHSDPTRYVTRSVANHLNDITKINPQLAMERLQAWAGDGRQSTSELTWMTRHALRGLVKKGDPSAMRMVGFDPDAPIQMADLKVPEIAKIGQDLTFHATLLAKVGCKAMVDYVFWRQRANGSLAPKVFKLKQLNLVADDPVTLTKRHNLKADATTFRWYPGPHRIEVQVNGCVLGGADFTLVA